MMFQSRNPFTTRILAEFHPDPDEVVRQKLEASRRAFPLWKSMPLEDRLGLLLRLAGLIEERREILAVAMAEEMGKTITEARAEILKSATGIRYFVQYAHEWLEPKQVKSDSRFSQLILEPLGGVLLIMPWNFPLWQVIRAALPALCTGNVILLKHAPNVFRFSKDIEGLFQEAGFPEGVLLNFLVDVPVLDSIMAHPAVAAVSFTGSEKAGRAVAALAGRNLRKCVLELGGSDPFLVMPDADLEFAADMAAKARLINNGQSCIAAKRFLVHASVENEFLSLFSRNLSRYLPADPLKSDTLLGPQARPDLVTQLEHQVKRSLEAGAEMAYQMAASVETGYFFLPQILRQCRPGMACFDEEVFGPVAAVSSFETTEEAIGLANQTRYGLGASIYSADEEAARSLARKLECGTVSVNAMVRSKPSLPFGGIKASGYGRELSEYGLLEFANLKAITVG